MIAKRKMKPFATCFVNDLPAGAILLQPNTLQIIEEIKNSGINRLDLFFTIDGPNVHLIYFGRTAEMVLQLVKDKR